MVRSKVLYLSGPQFPHLHNGDDAISLAELELKIRDHEPDLFTPLLPRSYLG